MGSKVTRPSVRNLGLVGARELPLIGVVLRHLLGEIFRTSFCQFCIDLCTLILSFFWKISFSPGLVNFGQFLLVLVILINFSQFSSILVSFRQFESGRARQECANLLTRGRWAKQHPNTNFLKTGNICQPPLASIQWAWSTWRCLQILNCGLRGRTGGAKPGSGVQRYWGPLVTRHVSCVL